MTNLLIKSVSPSASVSLASRLAAMKLMVSPGRRFSAASATATGALFTTLMVSVVSVEPPKPSLMV